MCQLHGRRDATDAHVGTFVVVAPKPSGGKMPYLFKALKEILVQPVIAHCSIVPLDVAVLLRLTGLDVCQVDTFSPSLGLQLAADVFRAVIPMEFFGTASPFDYVLQYPQHAFRRQGKVNLNIKPFAVIVINNIQQSYTASIL